VSKPATLAHAIELVDQLAANLSYTTQADDQRRFTEVRASLVTGAAEADRLRAENLILRTADTAIRGLLREALYSIQALENKAQHQEQAPQHPHHSPEET
jgi:hypothetical protein